MSEVTSSAVQGFISPNQETPLPQASYQLQAQAVAPLNDLFRYLDEHWTLIDPFSWSTEAQPGTILFSRPITPRESFPVLEYISRLYNTWSGTVNYRLESVSTAFLGGKLACSLLPPNFNPRKTQFTAQQLSVWPYLKEDVKNTSSMDMATGDMNAAKFHYFPHENDDQHAPQFIGGWFVVYVVNTLVTSGGTLGTVTVQMSANARGLMLAGIVPPDSITPGIDFMPVTYNSNTFLPYGDSYRGIALMSRTEMPTASVYLDGVIQGDGTPYTGRALTVKAPIRPRMTQNGGAGNQPLNLGGAVYPRQTLRMRNKFAWSSNTYTCDTQITTVDNVCVLANFAGVSTGESDAPTPLHTYSWGGVSAVFPSSNHFTPLGTSPESFIMFLGSWMYVNESVLPLNSYTYWQAQPVVMKSDQCIFGQIVDNLTGSKLCYFKLYFQGFMTTSAVTTTTIVDHPVTLNPISVVDPHFPMPVSTAEMVLAQLAMTPREKLKIEKRQAIKNIVENGSSSRCAATCIKRLESSDWSCGDGTCRSNLSASPQSGFGDFEEGWSA